MNFRYIDQIVLQTFGTSGADVPVYHQFTANSLYDPDYTGTGHQPLGFDQMMAFYDHYAVLSCEITVAGSVNTGTTTDGLSQYLGIFLDDDYSVPTSGRVLMEQQRCAFTPLLNYQTGLTEVRHRFDARSFFGVQSVRDVTALKGTSTSSPSEIASFMVFMSPILASVNTTANLTVILDFEAVLTEPKDLPGS